MPATRTVRLTGAAVLLSSALILTVGSPASAATDVLVTAADLGTAYAGAGQTTWLADNAGGGTDQITTDVFDGRSAVKLSRPSTGSQVNIFHSYGAGVRPTSVPDVLAGASYSYSGNTVNFQLAMFYTPVDLEHYGPSGTTSACTQAVDSGAPRTDMCFTILKFETDADVTGRYNTIDLSTQQAPHFIPGGMQPGWWNTQRVGQYSANATGPTLDQFLAEMSHYEIYAIGASVGTGPAGGDSWLLNLTYGGTSYSFGTPATAAAAAAPPVSSSDQIGSYAATNAIDIPADTAQFVPTGAVNADLRQIDPGKPVNGEYRNWSDPTDAFADVYSYSTASYVGTYPIVNGNVVLSGADLSRLGAGAHFLLFRGQTSGTVAIVSIQVIATLPATGVAQAIPMALAGTGAVLVGAVALLLGRRTRTRARRAD